MNWRLKICDYHHIFFPNHYKYTLYKGSSAYQRLTVEYHPKTNFLGMFSNGNFMAGYNTRTKLPWNSPFFLADFYVKQPKKFLFLGGGPCCAPTALWKRDGNRSVLIDIVEQDPLALKLAAKYFDLPRDSQISAHYTKSQRFLASNRKKYDVVFFDLGFSYQRRKDDRYSFCAFKSTIEQLKKSLTPKGIIIYVVISSRQDSQKLFLNKLYKMFKNEFRNCDLYADAPLDNGKVQSHVFVLSQNSIRDSRTPIRLANLNKPWLKMYKELVVKQMDTSVLTQ